MSRVLSSATRSRIDLSRAIDTHMHVFNLREFPVPKDAAYQPLSVTVADVNAVFANDLPYKVVVHPSVYKTDNTHVFDAIEKFGKERARGVVVFDPNNLPDPQQLDFWHSKGARGVRINLASHGQAANPAKFEADALQHAALIKDSGWALDLHLSSQDLPTLAKVVPQLKIPVIIDHFGGPKWADNNHSQDPINFSTLLELVAQKNVYCKISAPYRFSDAWEDFKRLFVRLYEVAPTRLLFASDYPHTRYQSAGIDTHRWTKLVVDWCLEAGGQEAVNNVFQYNAASVFGFPSLARK